MKTKCHDSIANVRLMESDPSAYFEKLLQQLNELEEQLANRNEETDAPPEERGRTATPQGRDRGQDSHTQEGR
jgi:hypothetical protein